MLLASIHVYPIKGAAGLSLDEAEVTDRGFRHDRRFMVVDAEGTMITQRDVAALALVTPRVDGDALEISAPAVGSVRLAIAPDGERRTVRVWSSSVQAVDAGGDAAALLSQVLGRRAHLVFMPDSSRRRVDGRYAKGGELVGFADAFPFLLANESSLEDLNTRLKTPVPMNRFRPNLVVRGAAPWAEDDWDEIRIGALEFSLPKPCDRCVVTTIDQETARKSKEPLATLATFRSDRGRVLFGENLLHRGVGALRVGDPLEILAAK